MPPRSAPRRAPLDTLGHSAAGSTGRPLGALGSCLVALGAAIALTWVFWAPLWSGGGLIGGDTYTYYFPQKSFFVDCLRAGEWPWWNDRSGHGYPAVAESQTGIFYPPHWLLYGGLELNTAYNIGQLLHYVLAFVAMWLYARAVGLSLGGGLITALVYTYGWFPSRICLEWAIVGGAWLPVALWCVERFLKTQHWRYALGLSLALTMQMLPGHFNLAFITQLAVIAYLPLRLWFAGDDLPPESKLARRRILTVLLGCLALAFLLSAVQLVPTWELRQLSQRAGVNVRHDPGYGYIPAQYLLQMLQPWYWYTDADRFEQLVTPGGPATNPVEAHLYLGLIPLLLAGWGLWLQKSKPDRRLLIWLILGGAAVIYATGWLIPVARHLPGFSFFQGAGRYSVLAALAGALLAGVGLQSIQTRLGRWGAVLPVFVLLLTTADLWLVSRLVTYTALLENPPIKYLSRSPVRSLLTQSDAPPRVYSPAGNLATLLGVSATPPYLGLGPAAYYDPELVFPGGDPFQHGPTADQIAWLQRAGVTHILSFVYLDSRAWPVQLQWQGVDPILNSSLARGNELLFLYELQGSRGRVAWAHGEADATARVREHRPNRVVVEAESAHGGQLILTELDYPGWEVTIDDQPATGIVVERMYRGVAVGPGKHTVVWHYRPRSLYWGGWISGLTWLALLAVAHVRYWHPHWLSGIKLIPGGTRTA